MTIDEASKRYNIPLNILHEYERWGLCNAVKKVMGAWQYDDTDLERLSLIMTLHDIGFESFEIETYMKLLLEKENRLSLLSIVAYSFEKEIELKDWFIDYFNKNNTYIRDQRENYLVMKNDVDNFITM